MRHDLIHRYKGSRKSRELSLRSNESSRPETALSLRVSSHERKEPPDCKLTSATPMYFVRAFVVNALILAVAIVGWLLLWSFVLPADRDNIPYVTFLLWGGSLLPLVAYIAALAYLSRSLTGLQLRIFAIVLSPIAVIQLPVMAMFDGETVGGLLLTITLALPFGAFAAVPDRRAARMKS